jgi:hypothetical protein
MFDWISQLTLIEWGVISSMVFALASLLIVLYQEFFRGPKLHFAASQIGILRTPANDKKNLLMQMLVRDLLSGNRSPAAQQLVDTASGVRDAIQTGAPNLVTAAAATHSESSPINYNPPDDVFSEATHRLDFSLNFFVPISVHNSGKKTGHVRSLVLVLYDESNPSDRWVFTSFVELDAGRVLDRSAKLKDSDRIRGLFAGLSVAPSSSHQLTPWFTPIRNLDGQPIASRTISPGRYRVRLFAYDAAGNRNGEADLGVIALEIHNFRDFFSGSESLNWLHVEEDIRDAILT